MAAADATPAWIAAAASGVAASLGFATLLLNAWVRWTEGHAIPVARWEVDTGDPSITALYEEAGERQGPDFFVVTNLGPGLATITDLELTDHPGRAKNIIPPLPLPVTLAKGESQRFYAVMGADELPTPLEIAWRDNRRCEQRRTVVLTH